MRSSIPLARFTALVTIPVFCSCYDSSGNHQDVFQDGDAGPDQANDDWLAEQEEIPQDHDADGDPVPECRLTAIGESRQVTFNTAYGAMARDARLVFTGSEFGLFWNDSRQVPPMEYELFFARLSLEGERLSEDTWLEELEPALGYPVFSGSEYAIAYWRMIGDPLSHELHFARIFLDGGWTEDSIVQTSSTTSFERPYTVFAGSGYGIVWTSNVEGVDGLDFNIDLLLLDIEGTVLGDVKKLVEDSGDFFTDWTETVFTGSEFALLWNRSGVGSREAFLARFSPEGTPLGEPTTVYSCPSDSKPQLAYGGNVHGVLFAAEYPTPLEMNKFLALLSDDGDLLGDYIEVLSELPASSLARELVYGEGGFCAAWLNDGDNRIYGVLVGNDGTVAGPEAPLTPEGVHTTDTFSIVAAGDEYALAWTSESNLYFARAGCR